MTVLLMRFLLAIIVAFFVLSSRLEISWMGRGTARYALPENVVVLADENATDSLLRGTIDDVSSSQKIFVQPFPASEDAAKVPFQSLVEPESEKPPLEELPLQSQDFCAALKEAAEQADIPIAFFARLLWQESKFQWSGISSAGAQGVAQFMPTTAAEVGLQDPFDPFQALPASAKLLRKLRDQFGNLGLAAAAYNAGSGRIRKWVSRQSPLPQETQAYVRIITGNTAETWIEESKTIALRAQLPREAPCEGTGGLSKDDGGFVRVQVALNPLISVIKGKADEQQRKIEWAKLAAAAEAISATAEKRRNASKQLARIKTSSSRRSVAVSERRTTIAKLPRHVRVASAAK